MSVEQGSDIRQLFLKLAKENEAVLVRVARRLNSNFDEADDAVQDALINAYRAMSDGKFTDFENFRPWVLKILVNATLLLKRQSKIQTIPERDLRDSYEPIDPEPGIELQMIRNTLPSDLQCALDLLPEIQRICVVLVDVQDLSYEETSAILGIPIGTIRSRLSRARLAMYRHLTQGEQ